MVRSPLFLALCLALAACSGDDAETPTGATDPFANAAGSSSTDDGTGAAAGASGGAAGHGSGGPAAPGPLGPPTLPQFPGAGTSDAAEPLPNGMLCDSVPGTPLPIADPIQECFFDSTDPTHLAATLEQVLECAEETDTVHIRLTFHPWFVDNTYGANAIGWEADAAAQTAPMMMGGKMPKMPKMAKGGHTFDDLVGSDHAEILLRDGSDQIVMQFKLDYISQDASSPSGYASLGVTGGEGKMIVGDAANVVRWMTSEDRNLNERGYGSYVVDSPATDDAYTPNPSTPEWDYRVVYEAWISLDAFGDGGFGGAEIEFVHASPSKADSNTIDVTPGDCPPPPCGGSDPDATCSDDPPDEGPCGGTDPDAVCADGGLPPADGGVPPGMMGPDCEAHPEQCMVD